MIFYDRLTYEIDKEKVKYFISLIFELLPKIPRSFDTSDNPGFWTNGSEILCPSETECEILASFLTDLVSEFSNCTIITGYYDPFEDAENDESDDMSGFYYIRFE